MLPKISEAVLRLLRPITTKIREESPSLTKASSAEIEIGKAAEIQTSLDSNQRNEYEAPPEESEEQSSEEKPLGPENYPYASAVQETAKFRHTRWMRAVRNIRTKKKILEKGSLVDRKTG